MNQTQTQALADLAIETMFRTDASSVTTEVRGFEQNEKGYGCKLLLKVTLEREVPEPAQAVEPVTP